MINNVGPNPIPQRIYLSAFLSVLSSSRGGTTHETITVITARLSSKNPATMAPDAEQTMFAMGGRSHAPVTSCGCWSCAMNLSGDR
jgi:hypothetical protein